MIRGLVVLALALAACGGMAAQAPAPLPADTPAPASRFTPGQFQIVPTPPPATPTPSAGPSRTPYPSPSVPAGSLRYVAIGASDTTGVGATDPAKGSWPALLAARLPSGATYTNLGVSGSLARQAAAAQVPRAVLADPTVVTIWLAVNDLDAQVDAAAYSGDMRGVIDPLLAGTQAQLFIGNVPDLRSLPAYAGADKLALARSIDQYNAIISGLVLRARDRITIVDLSSGSADLMSGATVASDGFHPSDAGHRLIADRFAAALRARGIVAGP